jgi:hypothetical protein
MPKRKYRLRFPCQHPGCDQTAHCEAETRDEEKKIRQRYENKWTCVRHSNPEELLSASNTKTRFEAVAARSEKYPDLKEMYFGGSGFLLGPGFKVYPKDFPEGTKLIVTAEIVLPPAPATEREG